MKLISNVPISEFDNIAIITTYQGSMSYRIHSRGFLEIAQLTIRETVKNRTSIDAIIPSIIYAIRHSVELFLKYVISELYEIHNYDDPIPQGHKIKIIFNDKKKELESLLEYEPRTAPFPYKQWLIIFEEIIDQVDLIDPDGQTMRYPTDKTGTPNLSGKINISTEQVMKFSEHVYDCYMVFINRNC